MSARHIGGAVSIPSRTGQVVVFIGKTGALAYAGEQQVNTDLVLAFDRSASMSRDPEVPGFATRLELATSALTELIETYARAGTVNLAVVGFATDAQSSGWFEGSRAASHAAGYLQALRAGGWTNYQSALDVVQATFDSAPGDFSHRRIVYFVTDGVATRGGVNDQGSLSELDVGRWRAFFDDASIDSVYAIGIGDDVTVFDTDLHEVALPESSSDGPILVPDADLCATLLSTIELPRPPCSPPL